MERERTDKSFEFDHEEKHEVNDEAENPQAGREYAGDEKDEELPPEEITPAE